MQPTDIQVERSLAALTTADGAAPDTPRRSGGSDPTEALPEGLLEQIAAMPAVRPERLDGARSLLDAGAYPDAEVLANKMVGRIVCDRLR